MFDLPMPELALEAPWNLTIQQRLEWIRNPNMRIAYYYDVPDSSTFRYRCFAMVQAINTVSQRAGAAWFTRGEIGRLLKELRRVDVLVICRSRFTLELAHLAAVARGFGVRILYDCDDLVFEPRLVPLMVETLDQYNPSSHLATEACWDTWFASISRLRAAMELADEVVVTNSFLADQVRKWVAMPVSVIPNFMTDEQRSYSVALTSMRQTLDHSRGHQTHIGYFSGTPTHNRDFRLIVEPLARVLRQRPRTVIRIVGFLNLPEWFNHEFEDRIEFLPLTNYMNLQRLIAETEINIAPLQLNDFTNCKSELKFFEAGAVAVPTLASNTVPMTGAIEDRITGMLVGADAWESSLIEILDDYESLGRSIAEAAYKHVHSYYSGRGQFDVISEVLGIGKSSEASRDSILSPGLRGVADNGCDSNQKLLNWSAHT